MVVDTSVRYVVASGGEIEDKCKAMVAQIFTECVH